MATTAYDCELTSLATNDAPVTVEESVVREYRGGWHGYAIIDPASGSLTSATLRKSVAGPFESGFTPGKSATLTLKVRGPGNVAQTWPSVVTGLKATTSEKSGRFVYVVQFANPITYLSHLPIWGLFQSASPAEIVGGAMSLAAGGTPAPTTTPTLDDMPTIRFAETLRYNIQKVPYAIATGEPLGHWLNLVLARLGVRMECSLADDGAIVVTLRDGDPSDKPLPMWFETTPAAGQFNALATDLRAFDAPLERGVLLDNPSIGNARRMGEIGPVGQVISAARIDADEGELRAGFHDQAWRLAQRAFLVTTQAPDALAGLRLAFVNTEIDAARTWQISDAAHSYRNHIYRNLLWLQKDVSPARALVASDNGPTTISGMVDDTTSDKGETVARDELGRIPVRLMFQSPDVETDTARLPLTIIGPLGGDGHGFVHAHRQGDICRVLVHHPLFAEVMGFRYGADRRVAADFADASMGMTVRHGTEDWAGLVFRPGEQIREQLEVGDDA